MLFYVECVSSFNREFCPDAEKFYTAPENLYETVLAFIQKHQLEDRFRQRARDIVMNATDGWGHQDSLAERYSTVYDEDGDRMSFY